MMIRYCLLVLMVGFGIEVLNAQAGASLGIPVDSRNVAMGGAYATNSVSNGIYGNFASSALNESKWDIGLSYRPWVNSLSDGYNLTSFSGGVALNAKHKIALGYQTFSFPEMNLIDDNGNIGDNFQPKEYRIGLGYAYLLSEKTAFSATIHFFNSEVSQDYSANAIVLDFGFKSQFNALEYGLVIKNLGTKLNFENGEVDLPLTLAGGLGYEKLVSENNGLRGQLDVSYISTAAEENGMAFCFGGEYQYKSMLPLRAGYYLVDENIGLSHFSVGAGLDIKGFDFGVAYLVSDNALDQSYSLSLAWRL